NVLIDIASPPEHWDTLGDGYKVEAHIGVWHQDAAVTVPVGAVFREGERRSVFVAPDGRAKKRTIEALRRNSQESLVTSGLDPGERVIVCPSNVVGDREQVVGRAHNVSREFAQGSGHRLDHSAYGGDNTASGGHGIGFAMHLGRNIRTTVTARRGLPQ